MEFQDRNSSNLTNGQDLDTNTIYYGVHIPYDVQVEDNDESKVYQNKIEALKLVRKYKQARFKAFNFYHEAVEFAVNGSETHIQKSSLQEVQIAKDPPIIGEKPPAFRGPKSQDLVKLRKNIEAGLLDVVSATIWDNPRYLISSGDTPSILQEGSRYNALHIAAKAKNRAMSELILNTVSNTIFIKLLYGDDSHQDANERAIMLLDLYLNTPDKGLNETPLHFAVKFGAVDIVELLVSYSQCDKTLSNKYGKTPNMIICDRCESSPSEIKNKIALLLEENFYVPVLRSEDNCIPPVIGEPFAPSSPPNFNTDSLNPRVEIHAYAGPMDKDSAKKFQRVWKTPPRSLKLISTADSPINLKFNDLEKGLERLGKNLSLKFDVGWKEYWPFLGAFIDLSSNEGLEIFENYLSERFNAGSSTSSSPKYTSSETELSNDVGYDNSISPMSELCKNFAACNLTDGITKHRPLKTSSAFRHSHYLLNDAQIFKTDLNPLLCVEKACQVFAHRVTNDILHLLESDYTNTTVVLQSQMKQFELLMSSFLEDDRFTEVNFHLVHYRLGWLIGNKLKDVIELPDEFSFMKNSLESWLESFNKQIDNFSSDDESGNYRQACSNKKLTTSQNDQIHCLLECILNTLINSTGGGIPNINAEDDCIRAWNEAKPCCCTLNSSKTHRNTLIKKSSSFKQISNDLASPLPKDELTDNKVEDYDINKLDNSVNVDEDKEDEYHTPPCSPKTSPNSDEEDVFEDCTLPDHDIFIEGNLPTRTDYAAYNALKCGQNKINPHNYPYIYKWCHSVNLFSDHEQRGWPSPRVGKYTIDTPMGTSTPSRPTNHDTSVPISNSWLRITGANSPRSTLKKHCPSGSLSYHL